MLDERTTHEENEQESIEDDSTDTDLDDDTTPADTDEDGEEGSSEDEPKKEGAAEVKAKQKKAWLDKIKSGEKKLDDMPDNLGWLKKEIKADLEPEKKKEKEGDLDGKIEKILTEREAAADFNALIEDLDKADISEEQDAQLREVYEDLLSDFPKPTASQKLKALTYARSVVGLKGNAEAVRERRRKGRKLPAFGGKRRVTTGEKEAMTDIEKKYNTGLPPGYKA